MYTRAERIEPNTEMVLLEPIEASQTKYATHEPIEASQTKYATHEPIEASQTKLWTHKPKKSSRKKQNENERIERTSLEVLPPQHLCAN